MPRHRMVTGVVFLVLGVLLAGTGVAAAQTGSPALSGKVTAEQGVQNDGHTHTVIAGLADTHWFPPRSGWSIFHAAPVQTVP